MTERPRLELLTTDLDPAALPGQDGVRGQYRSRSYRRVSHGVYLLVRGHGAQEEFLRELMAWLLVLPTGAAFTHLTAARLMGWRLPALPEHVPVFAAVRSSRRPRRHGLVVSRLTHPSRRLIVHGLPVDQPEEVLLRCARDLGVLDLVQIIDSARRLGHLDAARMAALLASGRPGVRVLREAWALSDRRATSSLQSVLRVLHAALEVPVEPQAALCDAQGVVVARADLLVSGTHLVHEVLDDGRHRSPRARRASTRRRRAITSAGFRRRDVGLDDLLSRPHALMVDLDRTLGRTTSLRRLRAWRRLVDDSTFSPTTRARLVTRWFRDGVPLDWSPGS